MLPKWVYLFIMILDEVIHLILKYIRGDDNV